jgi:AraC-like DNA-binding protein
MREPIPVYVHLRRAKDLINRDFAEALDVPALARAAHASSAHFVRGFKEAFGETPHQYLLRRRIERAKELLRNTQLSVTAASLAVGFRNLGSFSTAFRQLVGDAPSVCARHRRAAVKPRIPACFTLMHTRPHASTFEKQARATRASVAQFNDEGGTTVITALSHSPIWVLRPERGARVLHREARVRRHHGRDNGRLPLADH